MGVSDRVSNLAHRGWAFPIVLAVVLLVVTVVAGMVVRSQTPATVALVPVSEHRTLPSSVVQDASAQALADRLEVASGRSLESLVEDLPAPVANPIESEAPTVAAAQAATEEYAEILAALQEAEAAAAQQLAVSQEQLAEAERARREASKSLAQEEAAAARQIDLAIANAIAAAQATDAFPVPLGADFGAAAAGSIPTGATTTAAEVLKYVRTYFPADQVGNAMAVARCESGLSNVVGSVNSNGTRDFGVFQINDGGTLQAALRGVGIEYSSISEARKKALNPATNVRLARAIWDSRGWQPWVCAAKVKVVAGLYQSAPGPMAGQYDEYGRAR